MVVKWEVNSLTLVEVNSLCSWTIVMGLVVLSSALRFTSSPLAGLTSFYYFFDSLEQRRAFMREASFTSNNPFPPP